jgi:hypothetical protein
MNKAEVQLSVMRQALIEFAARRKCYDPGESIDSTREGLRKYVDERYGTHPQKFQADKLEYLVPRMRIAYDLLREIADA